MKRVTDGSTPSDQVGSTSGPARLSAARSLTVAVLMGAFATCASAGVVLFDPPEVAFDPTDPARVYEFAVTVDSEPGGAVIMQGLDMVFGSSVMELLDFEYSQEFLDKIAFTTGPPICGFLGCVDNVVGGLITAGVGLPFLIGTQRARFAFSTHWMSDPPEYAIFVDSVLDGGFTNLNGEPLTGFVRLIPEPATALLFFFGTGTLLVKRQWRWFSQ